MRTLLSSKQVTLRLAALEYAERGWPVLPLVPRAKHPLTKRGLLDASADPTQVNEWWSRWPNANIGLRTGVLFDVLDIDGDVGRASLEAKAGPDVAHSGPVSRTGRGEHWLFAPTGTANRANLLDKLDWRGVNGYIVAPPSIHPDGHRYEWASSPASTLPPVPEWLTPYLTAYKPTEDRPPIRVREVNKYDRHHPVKVVVLDAKRLAGLRTDIVAMARELGYDPMPRGARWVMTCIFHDGDHEASLTLYPTDNSFYCYGCQAWGDALNLRDKRPGGRRG